ncbi:hypothetical protein [Streptomyces graminilatus]|uniref:hypothetical protein n=1 Tax=Streptomyces graminilatus TaxID=1464070 RepID=UPI000A8C7992|nr:hypothetical protein [Streptomyces graminilatus]
MKSASWDSRRSRPGRARLPGPCAATLYVAPSSLPKYVQSLNQAISAAFGGAPARLLLASTVDGASGHRLAGR